MISSNTYLNDFGGYAVDGRSQENFSWVKFLKTSPAETFEENSRNQCKIGTGKSNNQILG